jgi:hypothetical protein
MAVPGSHTGHRSGDTSMTVELMDAPTPKTRKPRAVKTAPPIDASKEKVTLCLAPDANLRLTIHAAAMGMDRSALVEKLIRDHLRRFVLQDRGERDSIEDRQTGEA